TALNHALDEEKEKAENYLANWQRAQADFTNYKRRSEQEKEELSRFTKAQVMTGLLSVLDDMERALESIAPQMAESSWVEGIRLIERKLRTSLESQGLSLIQALGETFDPNFHQAAGHSKGEEGIVVLELQKGYMLYDRVLRPSMVIVGNGEAEQA
ncbi:MAG TPA: nucleotide exchange factor GrpE, partial [Dehalococcoidia bacterium]|nr:nucleotide exchange factor GrpE [Dehalococcoidia bacterium]